MVMLGGEWSMGRHEVGVVAVDLRVTRTRFEALDASNAKYDLRCILYTNDVQSRHRYVHVQQQERPLMWALAEVRPSVDGINWISTGLLVSLAIDNEAVHMQDHYMQLVLSTVHDSVEKTLCSCTPGAIASVRVHFTTRPRPNRAIVEGLKRIISTALHRETIWSGKQSRISWLNTAEVVEYHAVAFARKGIGCCEALGFCTDKTVISLSFQNDKHDVVDLAPSYTFSPVMTYTQQVETRLGGVHAHATRVISAIITRLGANTTASSSVSASVGAILSGLPGIGKTVLVKAICDSIGVHVRYLSATDVFQTFAGHSEAQIVKTFEALIQQAPSILVVDGLEAVATSRQGFLDSESTLEVGVLGTFVSCLEKLKVSQAHVFVLGTTSRLDDIDPAVYTNGRMDLLVKMEPPSQKERLDILSCMMHGWEMDPSEPNQTERLSEATGGFVGADLLSMCQKALQLCLNDPATADRRNPIVLSRHFDEALSTTYPSVLQAHHASLRHQESVQLSPSSPFDGIYGVDDALQTIRVSLLEPLEDFQRFLQFGTVPPKGILLTGPPGSGKTHLANVVAAELRRRGLASFISVRCTDLLTKVVGDTEKALRELFDTARSAAPCVIYFDQIESIAPVRGFDTSTEQTFDRLLSMLLVEMDGFSSSQKLQHDSIGSEEARNAFLKHHVVILASTTKKNQLDPAILRPGRFDVHIELHLPNRDARFHIFQDALESVTVDYSQDPDLSSPQQLASFVAEHTEGFAAGDLASLLREAAMASMREHFETSQIATKFIREALYERQISQNQ